MARPKPVHQLTAKQFDALFQTEDDCVRYLVARRWPEGIRCPRCGAIDFPRTEGQTVALAVLYLRA